MNLDTLTNITQRPLNHVSWLVDDIDQAARFFGQVYGIGPFLLVSEAELDEVSYQGTPCTFDHSAAFSKWGDLSIEVQKIEKCEPYQVAEGWGVGKGCHINHVSYTVADPDVESERLEELGLPQFLRWRNGPLHANCHRNFYGPSLEVHTEGTLDAFWEAIEKTIGDWDGKEQVMRFEPF
jgi:hypothetical protein